MWNPLGMRDRGFLLVFGGLCALLYLGFALRPMTYPSLLVAMIMLTTSFLFVASAQNGLMSTIGQQHTMTGQISAAWNVFIAIPGVASLLIGGMLSSLLEGPQRRFRRPHPVSRGRGDHDGGKPVCAA